MDSQMIFSNRPLAMSSREIADLVESRHDNVRVTIERLASRAVIALPAMQEKATAGRPAKEYIFSGEQGKRDSIIVVAQLCPEFTARLVDRWQELESRHHVTVPQTLPDALRLAADLAEENSSLRLVVQEQAPQVEALQRIADAQGTLCLTDAAKHLGVQRKRLIEWLRENRWLYRREGNAHWLAYQPRLSAGLLDHKVTVIGVDNLGDQRLASQVRVTPKGLTVLAQKLGGGL